MEMKILISVIFFTLALLLYSVATWSAILHKELKKRHLICFWIGFAVDLSGTLLIGSAHDGFVVNMHSIIGIFALLAILIQNIMAQKVLNENNTKYLNLFPKRILLPIWLLWMFTYFAGVALSNSH